MFGLLTRRPLGPVDDLLKRGRRRIKAFLELEPLPPPDGKPPVIPPPEPPPPLDAIMTRYGPAPRLVSIVIRQYFPSDQWVNAAEIAYLESGWNQYALNDTTVQYGPCGTVYLLPDGTHASTEISKGIFQINTCVHREPFKDAYFDLPHNVSFAGGLYQQSGWSPWFRSARHLGLI